MMQKVKNWAAPLSIFVVGEIFFLLFLLLVPQIDTGIAVTANMTANVSSTFWGWGWLMTPGVGRSIVLVGYQVGLCIAIAIAFLKSKN